MRDTSVISAHSVCATTSRGLSGQLSCFPNKLLIASCNGDEDLARAVGMQPTEVRIWFVVWSDTPSSVLERRMQEITLKLSEETRDLSHDELEQLVIKQVNQTSARIFFEKKYMPADSLQKVKDLNAQERTEVGVRALTRRLLVRHCTGV